MPADAAVVAYCNVQDVMHSQLRQKLQQHMPNREEGQAEFERETGINIERDIDRVVGFLVPDGHQGRIPGHGAGQRPVRRRAGSKAWRGSTAGRSPTTRASG